MRLPLVIASAVLAANMRDERSEPVALGGTDFTNPHSMANAGLGQPGSVTTGSGGNVIENLAKHQKESIGKGVQKERRRRGTGAEARAKMKGVKKMGMLENVLDLRKEEEEYEKGVYQRMDALPKTIEVKTKPTMHAIVKAAYAAETAAQFFHRASAHDIPDMIANFTGNWSETAKAAKRHSGEVLNEMRTQIGRNGVIDNQIKSQLKVVKTKIESSMMPIYDDKKQYQKTVDEKLAKADEQFMDETNEILESMADVSKVDRKELEKEERKHRKFNAKSRKDQKVASSGLKRFSTFETKYLKDMMTMVVGQESYMSKDMQQMQLFLKKIRTSTDKYWKRVVKRGNKAVAQAYKKAIKIHDKTKEGMEETLDGLVTQLEETGGEEEAKREEVSTEIETMFERAMAAAEATQGSASSIGELASEVQLAGKARLQAIEADAKDEQRAADDAAKAASTMRRKRIDDTKFELAPLAREKAKYVDDQVTAGDRGLGVFDEKLESYMEGLYQTMEGFEDDATDGAKDLTTALEDARAMLEELTATTKRSNSYQLRVIADNDNVRQEGLTLLDARKTKMESEISKSFEYLPELSKNLGSTLSNAKLDVQEAGRDEKRKAYLSMSRAVGQLDNAGDKAIEGLNGALAKAENQASTSATGFSDVLQELSSTLNELVNQVIPEQASSIQSSAKELDEERQLAERPLVKKTGALIERTEHAMQKLVEGYMKGKATLVDAAMHLAQTAQNQLDGVVQDTHAKLNKLQLSERGAMMTIDSRLENAADRSTQLNDYLNEAVEEANIDLNKAKRDTGMVQLRADTIRSKARTDVKAMEKEVDGEIKGSIDSAVQPLAATFKKQQEEANAAFEAVKEKLRETQQHYATMLSKTGADTDEQIQKLRDTMHRAQTEYDADLLKSTGMANSLFAMVSDAEHELSIQSVMQKKDAEQRKLALDRRAKHLKGEIDRNYGTTNAALAASMRHSVEASHGEMKKIASDEHADSEQMEAALQAEDEKLKAELSTMIHRAEGVGTSAEDYLATLSSGTSAVGNDMVGAEQGEKSRETAEAQAEIGVGKDEAREMGQQASNAEVIIGALGSMKTAANDYVKHGEDQWKKRQDRLGDETKEIVSSAHAGAHAIGQQAKAAHHEADMSLEETNKEITKIQDSVSKLKTEVEGNYLQVTKGIEDEKAGLNHDAGRIQHVAEQSVTDVADSVGTMVEAVGSIADTAHAAEQRQSETRGVHHEQLEKLQSFEHSHQAEHVNELVDAFKQLDMKHEEMHQWNAGFDGRTRAWRALVTDKLSELGYDIASEEKEMDATSKSAQRELKKEEAELGAEVSAELAAIQQKANDQIEALYAESDKKINAILARSDLSEEEKQKLIKEIEDETAKQASDIYKQQAEMEKKHIEMEQEVNRYNSMVKAAKGAVEAAIASGSLSPQAVAIYKKLLKVSDELSKLRTAPWLGSPESALEVAGAATGTSEKPSDVVHAANEAIRAADSSLEKHIEVLEAKLAKAKVNPL